MSKIAMSKQHCLTAASASHWVRNTCGALATSGIKTLRAEIEALNNAEHNPTDHRLREGTNVEAGCEDDGRR